MEPIQKWPNSIRLSTVLFAILVINCLPLLYVKFVPQPSETIEYAPTLGFTNETDTPFAEQEPRDSVPVPDRLTQATEFARNEGAELSIVLFDRATGVRASNGNDMSTEIASVSKLFIADELLFRQDAGEITLSRRDTKLIDNMLRASDDAAADLLWVRFGRDSIVNGVVSRYHLESTHLEPGDTWWQTESDMDDIVSYYAGLLDGHGGLSAAQSDLILGDLQQFTDEGTDGYYQRFGLPDALTEETNLAVKQGWMCCIDNDWIHLSTGVAGEDHRYIVALGARETAVATWDGEVDDGSDHARQVLTSAAAILFPEGQAQL